MSINLGPQKEFLELSARIGSDINLIQGAGGNTSMKENGTLWIKASGKNLKDSLVPNVFCGVRIPTEISESIDYTKLILDESKAVNLRPSIETSVHMLMPQKVVLHVHSVNCIAHAVTKNAKKKFSAMLKGLNWAWIDYCKPGEDLARAIRAATQAQPADVLILANHGLVVGGETPESAERLLCEVEDRIKISPNSQKPNPQLLVQYETEEFICAPTEDVHSIALDTFKIEIAKKGSLYPDHVVFLGPALSRGHQLDTPNRQIINELAPSNIGYIICTGMGLMIRRKMLAGEYSMLQCLGLVLQRLDAAEEISYLTQSDESSLLNWEAEKYRQNIAGK